MGREARWDLRMETGWGSFEKCLLRSFVVVDCPCREHLFQQCGFIG